VIIGLPEFMGYHGLPEMASFVNYTYLLVELRFIVTVRKQCITAKQFELLRVRRNLSKIAELLASALGSKGWST